MHQEDQSADRGPSATDKLRALAEATQSVVEELDLPVVLQRIVDAAVNLVGAQYGAVGVIAPHGGLEQFIHVGMSPSAVQVIGHLPEGHGLLGALIDDPRPIRLSQLSDDPRSAGFPAHHPEMHSFLGVPIRVREAVYGNLYLTNQKSGEFTADDEELVLTLAATAGFAIENARLFSETRRRQAWAAASAEITAVLLSADHAVAISALLGRVQHLASAALACLITEHSDPSQLIVADATGEFAESLLHATFPVEDSLSAAVLHGRIPMATERKVSTAAAWSPVVHLLGPVMAVPLIAGGRSLGVILVARSIGDPSFTPADLEMAADFAGQASVTLELSAARADQQRMMVLEDRGRIARDLHDHVIQQLFATGLELQNVAGSLPPGRASERVNSVISSLDAAISQIRTVIFALAPPRSDLQLTVRHQIIDLATEFAPGLMRPPSVSFAGPVDLVAVGGLADDVLAVIRESLANVAKHSQAEQASVAVSVWQGSLVVEVVDDGVGFSDSGRRSGIANLEQRATLRGGTFSVSSGTDGTRMLWSVPFTDEPNEEEVPT
ncbi:sensor histidine kinase [Subtercola frigoramans]|uniref:Signal transduction histidine kinase n=1 Tax=Subtercola frigoramans TaxID=120298 RepID=A0ABS2L5G8_9MICO|nr:GAF domain-containing protein [Subtercola frigoramans]MBM7472343.1 signal transduction histidine kinase [Subtercola frigoramans]